jgi:hypothetical protein
MIRTNVISSMMRSVGYDSGRVVLEIEFSSGKVYQYDNVPENVYRELLVAASKGRYFEQQISGRYGYRRL